VIWGAPLLIIIALGADLDQHPPAGSVPSAERLDASRPIAAAVKPLEVEVVALDWKWLFIYPEQGIATVNELYAPVDVPIASRSRTK
jgi:cytochrome o ubiquinol oxidase subunit 2